MRMEIRGRNLWLTPALLDHVERRVHGALGRHCERIRRVSVRLFDRNGDHGGPDKQCRIVVQTAALGGAVVVDDVDEDLYAAVSRAAARASEGLRRRLERLRSGRPSTRRSWAERAAEEHSRDQSIAEDQRRERLSSVRSGSAEGL